MGPRPPDAEMGHDAVASGRCVNELSGALCLWTVCGVVPGCLHTVRGYRTATGLWQAWPPHRASATPATRRSFFIDIFTRTKIQLTVIPFYGKQLPRGTGTHPFVARRARQASHLGPSSR